MPINTNITLTEKEKTIYQRFVNLSVNETPLPQGDATIRISPFDDYFLFTIFDEIEGEDTPIDLSNVGDIFINFIGQSDEIDIKNYTQVEKRFTNAGDSAVKNKLMELIHSKPEWKTDIRSLYEQDFDLYERIKERNENNIYS